MGRAERQLRALLTLKERSLKYVGAGAQKVAFALGKKVVKIEDHPDTLESFWRKTAYRQLCIEYFAKGSIIWEAHRPYHQDSPDISFQDNVNQFNDKTRFQFTGGYAEQNPSLRSDQYVRANESAILRTRPYNQEDFLALHGNTHVVQILEEADTNPAFRRNLEDFLSSLIGFSQKTGEILDCLGWDNVHLYSTPDDRHLYRIIDPLPPGDGPLIPETKKILKQYEASEAFDIQHFVTMINAVDYASFVNGMADHVHLPPERRVSICDGTVNFERLLRDLRPIATGK